MSYFSLPLASSKTTAKIQKLIKRNRDTLKRGISSCTKSILNKENGILVIASDISPEDLVSYMPPLAEENKIPYIFVKSMKDLSDSNEYMKPTTCCFIYYDKEESKTMKSVLMCCSEAMKI